VGRKTEGGGEGGAVRELINSAGIFFATGSIGRGIQETIVNSPYSGCRNGQDLGLLGWDQLIHKRIGVPASIGKEKNKNGRVIAKNF